ncbi:30S ribosomal S20 domain protein [Burkholderia pseudomallei]|nr:30S ribosomal S20 domain protein [Burkholderia pseudomallei]
MGFGVWGLGFGVWGLRFAVCGLRFGAFDAFDAFDALDALDALDAFGASDGAVAPACRGNRIAPAIAHHRAPPRTDALPARCRPRIRATTPPCGPRGPDGEKQRKLDGNPAHAKRAPAAAAIHVRSLSTSEAYPLRVRCLAGAKRAGAGASAHARRCAAVVFSRCAPSTLIRACARWLIGGESATARRPAALALGTEAARVQREAHARHRVTASPHADGHRRRRPREAPITSARPPRPKPAGARRGRPGSRADQGNAFVPSNAATANPETFVSWSGEPG